MNERGQILLPALAWYLGLLILFCGLVTWGQHQISQERMDMAASAAAISSARDIASALNKFSMQNVGANVFVNGRFKGFGAMQSAMVKPFELWLDLHEIENHLGNFQSVLNGFQGHAASVGSKVAKLNGAIRVQRRSSFDLRLKLNDLDVFVFYGIYPTPIMLSFENVYYSRLWGYNKRKAQPPHETIWSVADSMSKSTAAARVYLDVDKNEPLQNGGFPRAQGEELQGEFEIQSLYPQFNAKLIPEPLGQKVLDWVLK